MQNKYQKKSCLLLFADMDEVLLLLGVVQKRLLKTFFQTLIKKKDGMSNEPDKRFLTNLDWMLNRKTFMELHQ